MVVLVVGVALAMQAEFDTPRQKRHGGMIDTLLRVRLASHAQAPNPNVLSETEMRSQILWGSESLQVLIPLMR